MARREASYVTSWKPPVRSLLLTSWRQSSSEALVEAYYSVIKEHHMIVGWRSTMKMSFWWWCRFVRSMGKWIAYFSRSPVLFNFLRITYLSCCPLKPPNQPQLLSPSHYPIPWHRLPSPSANQPQSRIDLLPRRSREAKILVPVVNPPVSPSCLVLPSFTRWESSKYLHLSLFSLLDIRILSPRPSGRLLRNSRMVVSLLDRLL